MTSVDHSSAPFEKKTKLTSVASHEFNVAKCSRVQCNLPSQDKRRKHFRFETSIPKAQAEVPMSCFAMHWSFCCGAVLLNTIVVTYRCMCCWSCSSKSPLALGFTGSFRYEFVLQCQVPAAGDLLLAQSQALQSQAFYVVLFFRFRSGYPSPACMLRSFLSCGSRAASLSFALRSFQLSATVPAGPW